jgi:glycerophosphoryl diester phosphodiesterase
VPRLSALLAMLDGMPLLIELKVDGRHVAELCAAVARDLEAFPRARAAVMSFNPLAVRWFARHAPVVVRGLVVTQQREGWRGPVKRALALSTAKPDFLACDIRDIPSTFTARARLHGLPVLSWTVRSAAERARAARHADQIIFEHADV